MGQYLQRYYLEYMGGVRLSGGGAERRAYGAAQGIPEIFSIFLFFRGRVWYNGESVSAGDLFSAARNGGADFEDPFPAAVFCGAAGVAGGQCIY